MYFRSFRYFADQLPERTKERVKALHIVDMKDGTYVNLDFNISDSSYEAVRDRAVDMFIALPDGVVLPSAPEEDWGKVWNHKMLKLRGSKRLHLAGWSNVAIIMTEI